MPSTYVVVSAASAVVSAASVVVMASGLSVVVDPEVAVVDDGVVDVSVELGQRAVTTAMLADVNSTATTKCHWLERKVVMAATRIDSYRRSYPTNTLDGQLVEGNVSTNCLT